MSKAWIGLRYLSINCTVTEFPVLTCAGETFASRVAGSLLHAVGLPSW